METPSLFTEAAATAPVNPAPPQENKPADPPMGVLSIGVFQPAAAAAVEETAVAPQKKAGWLARFMNLFRRKAKVVEGPVVQTEWSMDRVKVVRNDLADADLDLVFASVEAASPKKAEPVKKQQLVSSAWRRVNPNPDKTEQMVLK